MDLTGYTILVVVFIISLYDFYNLKKLNIKLFKCFWSSILTFVLSFYAIVFLSVLLSMPFGEKYYNRDIFNISAAILILILNFYRINGRKLSKGKITRNKKNGFNNIIIGVLIIFYVGLFSSLTFYSIKYSFALWDKNFTLIEFGNYGLGGSIFVLLNNLLFVIFGSLSNEIASILLFILGITSLIVFSIAGYAFLKEKIK